MGADYNASAATRLFTNSTRRVCLDVVTLQDAIEEFPPETFNVILSSDDLSVQIGRSNSTGVILDDECKFL